MLEWPATRNTTQGELIRMHQEAESKESINPDHYKTGGIECIDAIRDALGYDGFIAYCRGQIIRYTWRLGKKDDALVEIGKAAVYAQWVKDTLDGKPLTKGKK